MALALGLSALATRPRAEPTAAEKTLASALFEQGRAMMAKGDNAGACAKLAESMRLDPGGGTLLNLALCHERRGMTATAHREFKEALAMAERDRRAERIDAARAHLDALGPKVPHLSVRVSPAVRAAGLDVKLDDVTLPEAAWGTSLPVDPGEHVVRASAPGKRPYLQTVGVAPGSAEQVVEIPLLEPEPVTVATAPTGAVSGPPQPAPRRDRTLGWVSLGVGAAAVGVGAFWGLRAISARREVEDGCPDRNRCTGALSAKNDDALRDADRSTVAVSVGLVGVAAGAYLLLRNERKSGWLTPRVDASQVGLAGGGAF